MLYYCFVMKVELIKVRTMVFMMACIILFQYCTYNHLPENNKTIILNWHSAPAYQSKEQFTTGLIWLFSYLGAALPKESFDKAVQFKSADKIEINIEELGFSDEAEEYLRVLLFKLKATEEYNVTGGIDAGRFFALCFNSSYHYYKITGAAPTFNDFSKKFQSFVYKTFACDTSAVAMSSRVLNYNVEQNDIAQNFFFAQQGLGYFTQGNFLKSQVIEAFDYMANGQPRFAIYDQQGNLYAPSDAEEHPAGKPAKCMWCHESGMQPLIFPTTDILGYETAANFTAARQVFTNRLNDYHKQTQSKLDFSDKRAHGQGEIIYMLFYEPDVTRLSQEWQLSEQEVKQLLSGVPTHSNPEYPFLKEVYHRKDVQTYAPFKSILVTDEMRESSLFEPNYLK